jgi:hypothetical protein
MTRVIAHEIILPANPDREKTPANSLASMIQGADEVRY